MRKGYLRGIPIAWCVCYIVPGFCVPWTVVASCSRLEIVQRVVCFLSPFQWPCPFDDPWGSVPGGAPGRAQANEHLIARAIGHIPAVDREATAGGFDLVPGPRARFGQAGECRRRDECQRRHDAQRCDHEVPTTNLHCGARSPMNVRAVTNSRRPSSHPNAFWTPRRSPMRPRDRRRRSRLRTPARRPAASADCRD
jgi:hypothetical protein